MDEIIEDLQDLLERVVLMAQRSKEAWVEEELLPKLQEALSKTNILVDEWNNNKGNVSSGIEDEFYQSFLNIVDEYLHDENFSLSDISRALNFERTQIYRKLKMGVGKTPSEIIKERRLERALHLLKTTQLNISSVAYQCGFKTAGHFTRSFKTHFGFLPSEVVKE